MAYDSFTRATRSHGSTAVPHRSYGSFVLDGANDPSVLDGCISEVRRLATGTPTIFYRVQVDSFNPNIDCYITASVKGTETGDFTVLLMAAPLTDAGGDVINTKREFDLEIKTAAVAVDTAGLVVQLHFDHTR